MPDSIPAGHTIRGTSFETIRSARCGDRMAFEELVRSCRARVFGTIGRMIARPEDIEDVAQEVFIRMHASIGQLQIPEAFELWSYRLTVNTAYDYHRKRPRRREVRMSDLLDQQITEAADSAGRQSWRDEMERRKILESVDSLLEGLSASDRILILMREVEGLSMRELAAVLGISTGAVKLRLFRARRKLREILNPVSAAPRDSCAGSMARKCEVQFVAFSEGGIPG